MVLPLSRMEPDREGEIDSIDGEAALAQRLLALGFLPGARLKVVHVAPLGDPIAVDLAGWRVSLRRRDASRIRVRLGEAAAG